MAAESEPANNKESEIERLAGVDREGIQFTFQKRITNLVCPIDHLRDPLSTEVCWKISISDPERSNAQGRFSEPRSSRLSIKDVQ